MLEEPEIWTESEKSDSSEDVKSLEEGCSVDLDQNGIVLNQLEEEESASYWQEVRILCAL